jgi:predicted secreted Zn-dependent protease
MKKVIAVMLILLSVCTPAFAKYEWVTEEVAPVAVYASTGSELVNVKANSGGQVSTTSNLVPASTVISGQKAVTTAGTEVVLDSSTAVLSVTVKAKHGNTNMIYVGTNPVSSSTGFVLDAGEAVSLDVDNLADVYIDADTNGEGVSYIAVVQ